jgi:hypothetical protein
LKPSKVLPVLPQVPSPKNDFCTPTLSRTSAFGMTAFNQFGAIETNLETDDCSYMNVYSTDMSPIDIKTRINTHLVYYRNNQSGDVLSYRRKMQGRSNLGYKANKARGKVLTPEGLLLVETPVLLPLHSPIKRCASA